MGDYRRYKPRDFDFARLLVILRKRAHLTQEEVALQIGVSGKAVRNWEGGSNYPSEVNLRRLIEIYLQKRAFVSGHEQDEAHLLWDHLHEHAPHRIDSFDEPWFATLLTQWQEAPQVSSSFRPSSRLLQGDWSEVLDVSALYGRSAELAELERWLLQDRCRVVALLGIGGIGKTTLAVKILQQVAPQFACVLWRSLHNASPLEELLLDWLPILAEQHDMQLPQGVEQMIALLIALLQQRRCLLVLDNLETLLQEGVLEVRYREGYEEYATLIRYVAETTHQSCLLLTCREQFPDLEIFTGSRAPVRMFKLGGLALEASQQMLQGKELFGEQAAWNDLVQRYAGNPLALKIVGETVHELFGGDISAFLAEGFTTFHGISQLLTRQFERLAALEQSLMYWLAIERDLTSLETLREDLWPGVTKSEALEALRSLRRRSLVERGEHGAVFMLQPVVLEYVTERLMTLVYEEVCELRPVLLLTHALLQAQAKDYVRTSQARLIVQPLLNRLVTYFGNTQRLEEWLERLLLLLRALPRAAQGYGGGNLVNFFISLSGHLKGKDCSHLTIWQADLRQTEAQNVAFAGSDLTGSAFMDAISGIVSVALSANGQYVAGGTQNGEIRLWRATDGQPLLTLFISTRLVWSLAFNPESTLLVSGGYDGLVQVWEVHSGQCLRVLHGHTKWIRAVVVHPDGKLLATGSDDRSIRLWDLSTGRSIGILGVHSREVMALACSLDGHLLASAGRGGIVTVWDLATEQCLWSSVAHHGMGVPALAFSSDGTLLVSGGEDAQIVVWDVASGTLLNTVSGHADAVLFMAFSVDGVLASGSRDHTIKLWKIGHEGADVQCMSTLLGHSGWVWSVAFGPEGLLASGSHEGVVKLWQISTGGEGGRCLRTLQGRARLINALALSFDGRFLANSELNGKVRIWETQSGQCLHSLSREGVSLAVVFHPDGQLIASSEPNRTIQLWDVESGRCLRTLVGHQEEAWSLAFSPDGHFLFSGSLDRTIKCWEVDSGRCFTTFQGDGNWIWSLACSPDGKLLASGDVDGMVILWEIATGRCLRTLQGSTGTILALRFTPDGTMLLSSNAENLVTVWDVQDGHCIRTVLGVGETHWLGSVILSADGSLLAASSSDRTVKIWNVNNGEVLYTLPCGTSQPWTVALSADQQLLACGTNEGNILLWEWQTDKGLKTLHSDKPYECMNISGVTGITEAQKASLKILGAIEEENGTRRENIDVWPVQHQSGYATTESMNETAHTRTARLNTVIECLGSGEHYFIYDSDSGKQKFEPDSPAWFTWLAGCTSFHFKGLQGHFTARCEHKRRGDTYWYAYRKAHHKLHKRYLGTTKKLTLAFLEDTALVLQDEVLRNQKEQ